MSATIPDHGEWERCGWRVQRPQYHLVGQVADFVRITNGTVWFYMPIEMYEDLDDEAFAPMCQLYEQRIISGEIGARVFGAQPTD